MDLPRMSCNAKKKIPTQKRSVSIYSHQFFHHREKIGPHLVAGFDRELEIVGGFEHQHDRRAELELGHLLAARRVNADFIQLREALANERILFLGVCSELGLVRDDDRADVRRADRRKREEAVLPLAEQRHALVLDKKARDQTRRDLVDREEVAWEVAALRDLPVGRRVDAVVVARREVEHAVEHLLAQVGLLLLLAREERRHATQKLVEPVARALDLLECGHARGRVHDADRRDCAVHGTRNVVRVLVEFARAVLERTREELAQVTVVVQRISYKVKSKRR